jgi:hypothetical protein
MPVQDSLKCTYQYVQVYTINKTRMFFIHQGSSSKVTCNSVKLQCKRYARMRSNFKKFKVQISQVHTGTYWYIPVRTGIDINHTRTLHFDDALAAFLRRRVSTARLTCSSCLALFLTAVSATERPPRLGLPRPNIQSYCLFHIRSVRPAFKKFCVFWTGMGIPILHACMVGRRWRHGSVSVRTTKPCVPGHTGTNQRNVLYT